MKKLRILTTFTSLVVAANLTAAYTLGTHSADTEAVPAASSGEEAQYTVTPTAAEEEEDAGYLLLDVEGRVCVYEGDMLLMKTDIEVASLPASDREALSTGIRAETAQELASSLEDFGS